MALRRIDCSTGRAGLVRGDLMSWRGTDLTEQQAASDDARIEQLEALVSRLRHDLRGVITPAALVGDQLRNHNDPTMQRAGMRITEMVRRVLEKLDETYCHVPPRGSHGTGPVLGLRQTGEPASSGSR